MRDACCVSRWLRRECMRCVAACRLSMRDASGCVHACAACVSRVRASSVTRRAFLFVKLRQPGVVAEQVFLLRGVFLCNDLIATKCFDCRVVF